MKASGVIMSRKTIDPSGESIRMLAIKVLFHMSRPMRSIEVARQLEMAPHSVGTALQTAYHAGSISRQQIPGGKFFAYFMTAEQKADMRMLDNGMLVRRYVIKHEPIDITARMLFLRKLADNPFWQEHAELHNIIADYKRTLAAQNSLIDMEEKEAA